ncbi:hypothetical protein MUK42_36720 [Musa troglodytarum]|nr:hypothetical protein MUK42_36720 [Musa troglodytarum]
MASPRDQPVNPASTSPADGGSGGPRPAASKKARKSLEGCGRERLKRHRVEMAGRVCIPETWGQESLLKDWADRRAFESFMPEAGIRPQGAGRRLSSAAKYVPASWKLRPTDSSFFHGFPWSDMLPESFFLLDRALVFETTHSFLVPKPPSLDRA